MKEYVLDCLNVRTRGELHDALALSLELPEYYGRNLDALYDCLTDMSHCRIRILNSHCLSALGDYGDVVLSVFREAAESNAEDDFTVEIL